MAVCDICGATCISDAVILEIMVTINLLNMMRIMMIMIILMTINLLFKNGIVALDLLLVHLKRGKV